MGRTRRIDVDGGRYHVMNRGVNRQQIFFSDADRIEFGRLLGDVHDRFGVVTQAYCLMTNHYHLVLHCPDGNLSAAMQRLGSVYVKHANERVGRDGPLFRGRFHAVPITDDGHLLSAVRYVHRNALDLPAVNDVDDYRWSSHRSYLGHRQSLPWLDVATVLESFGGDRWAFHRFVIDGDPIRALPRLDAEQMAGTVQLVAEALGLADGDLRSRATRTVLTLMVDLVPTRVRTDLLDVLDFATPKSMEQSRKRAQDQATDRPALRAIAVATVRALFGSDEMVPGTMSSGLALGRPDLGVRVPG